MKPRKSDSPSKMTPKRLNSRSLWPLVEGCKVEKLKKSRTIAQNGLASLADFVGAQQFSRNVEKTFFLWIRFFQWNNRPPGTQLEISDRMMGISFFSIFVWHVVRFSKKHGLRIEGTNSRKHKKWHPLVQLSWLRIGFRGHLAPRIADWKIQQYGLRIAGRRNP